MGGFLGDKEVLTRERVKEILRNKEYNFFEEKVNLLEVRDDSVVAENFLLDRTQDAHDRDRGKRSHRRAV